MEADSDSVTSSDDESDVPQNAGMSRDDRVAAIGALFHKLYPTFTQEVRDLRPKRKPRVRKQCQQAVQRRSSRIAKVTVENVEHANREADSSHIAVSSVQEC